MLFKPKLSIKLLMSFPWLAIRQPEAHSTCLHLVKANQNSHPSNSPMLLLAQQQCTARLEDGFLIATERLSD
jgi:hypothetical protein